MRQVYLLRLSKAKTGQMLNLVIGKIGTLQAPWTSPQGSPKWMAAQARLHGNNLKIGRVIRGMVVPRNNLKIGRVIRGMVVLHGRLKRRMQT